MKVGLERDETDAKSREVAVEVVVFGAGFVLAHAGVTYPVVAAFASTPMATSQLCKATGTAGCWTTAGDVKGNRGFFVFIESGGALDHDQGARAGQSCLQGFEGIDFYPALVQASVTGVRFFCVAKRGVPLAFCKAALYACRFSFLSWKK